MSSLLSAELSATCNSLGSLDRKTGKYLLDQFTLESVKDLIRFLRRDDEDHEVRRHLGHTDVLSNDLVQILISHSDNQELFDVTLRLVVNLTNPPLLLYREEIPTEKGGRRCYIQMVSQLMNYKKNAFTSPDIWIVLAKRLSKIIEIDSSERDEDHGLVIERILILVRNVLHIPIDDADSMKPDNDASIHDQVLWALNQSGLLDIILYMSSMDEKQYYLHILEIVSLMFREQNPTSLASAALQRSMEEKLKDEQELLALRKNESTKKQFKIKHFTANRHSNFGGTFTIQNMKSISDNNLICHKPLQNISSLNFDVNKDRVKKPKNRRPVDLANTERRSAFAIRLFLKEFCIEFLNASYNVMMYYVRDLLARSKGQKNDETYYMWAMKFFMEFNRNYNFEVKLVSETMSVSTFHYVQQQMEKCFEMIMMDKKKCTEWVRRLHLALRAYNELLQTMMAMDKSKDPSVRESSKVIKSNIFYVLEYREFILQIMLTFDETKMPKAYLKDLIETVHVFLKILEHFCTKHGLVVQKKSRSKAKKSKQKAATKPAAKRMTANTIDKEEMWGEFHENLTNTLFNNAEITTTILPFDATLDKDIEEQKGDCMKKIQKLLLEKRMEDSIGLLRAAREVWPEQNIFGSSEVTSEEELALLKTIFFADIGAESLELQTTTTANEDDENDENQYDEDEEDEEDEEERDTRIEESDFNFKDFIARFASPKVVKACSILLQNYEKNLPNTNHCIVKMLHRIAWDCRFPSMIFQASIFRTFQSILGNSDERYKELKKFAIFIFRKFTEVAKENPKVFMEILFYKTTKEAFQIENNYNDILVSQKGANVWTEEQEEELKKLYLENQTNPNTEMDVIDWILENLIDQTRTRRGVVKKLKELGMIFKAPTRKSNARPKVSKEFTVDEDEILRKLWSEYSDSGDPMFMIMEKMPIKRQKKQFIKRLLHLGIIDDKKECHKKKQRKNKSGQNNENKESSSELSSTDSENDGNEPQKRVKKPENNSETYLTSEFARVLIKCVDEGFTDALKWIIESFEEIALDQEAEGYSESAISVPLVPIAQECIDAMQNKVFQDTLELLGITPPSNEQEVYWRIPGFLHFEALRKRNTIITKAIEKTLQIPESAKIDKVPEKPSRRERAKSSDDDNIDDLFQLLRARNPIHEESDDSEKENSITKNKSLGSKSRKNALDSDSDDENSKHKNSQTQNIDSPPSKSKSKNIINDSDSNASASKVSSQESRSKQKRKKLLNSSSSEDENTPNTRTTTDFDALLNSENTSNNKINESQKSKKRIVSSDTDSDEKNSSKSSRKKLKKKKKRLNSSSSESNKEVTASQGSTSKRNKSDPDSNRGRSKKNKSDSGSNKSTLRKINSDSDSSRSRSRKDNSDSGSNRSRSRNKSDSGSNKSTPRKNNSDSNSSRSRSVSRNKSDSGSNKSTPRKNSSDSSRSRSVSRNRSDSGSNKSTPRKNNSDSDSNRSVSRKNDSDFDSTLRKNSDSDSNKSTSKKNNSDSDKNSPRKTSSKENSTKKRKKRKRLTKSPKNSDSASRDSIHNINEFDLNNEKKSGSEEDLASVESQPKKKKIKPIISSDSDD